MKAQLVYNLLEKVDSNNGLYESETFRLLKFIYQDVYSYIDKKIKESELWREKDSLGFFRDDLSYYLDGDESILTFYYEMISDNKKEFIDLFFSYLNRYTKILDNKFYVLNDFLPLSLTINLYIMLKGYHEYKNDLKSYSKLVEDFSFFINRGINNSVDYILGLKEKKNVLDKFIEIGYFDNREVLKEHFVEFVKDYMCETNVYEGKMSIYSAGLDTLCDVFSDFEVFRNHPRFNEEACRMIINEMFETCTDEDYEYFYSPILILGNRFEYFMNCYDKYINNCGFLDDVIDSLDNLDNELFDYLDVIYEDEQDSFITCMELVFDSDSFNEVNNKLNCLVEASERYSHGEKAQALALIGTLATDTYKDVVKGRKIMLDKMTVNLITNNSLIVERMKKAYTRCFGNEISGYCELIDESYEEEKNMTSFEKEIRRGINKLFDNKEQQEREQAVMSEVGEEAIEVQDGSTSIEETPGGLRKIRSVFRKK